MIKVYSFWCKSLFLLLLSCTIQVAKSQTLTKGDIAFTGYISYGTVAGTDEFSFVTLASIPAGAVIKFTENAWLRTSPTAGSFRTGEGTLQFTSIALAAGLEVRIVCSTTPTATYSGGSAGTVSILATTEGNGTAPAFSANGDQIIAYQGSFASPTFIAAIHMNSYNAGIVGEPVTNTTNWDGSYSTANASGLPSGTGTNFLTNGVDAIWIPANPALEFDNARFNCTGPLTTLTQIRASLFNVANWTTSNDAPGFTLPAGCTFFGTVPIKLINFQAENNISSILVKWSVTNQIDINEYEVQRSFNGTNFDKIGAVQSKNSTNNENINYTYTDAESLKASTPFIYYRLKFLEASNKTTFSGIVKVFNNKVSDIVITNFTNSINNKLAFTLNLKYAGQTNIQLIDANGRIIMSTQLKGMVGTNNINLPLNTAISKGIYILQIYNNTSTIIKKIYN